MNLDECVLHSISMNLDECVLFVLSSLFFVRFYSNACYNPYALRADRKEKNQTKIDIKINTPEAKKVAKNGDIIHSTPRFKRRKSGVTKCIICIMQ